MIQLTIQQKYAIVAILTQIMNADGVIHPKEAEYMDKVYVELGIKIGDIEDMTNIDEFQAKQIVREMSKEQKQYSQNLFVSMAKSDDFFHPKESAIIEKIFDVDM
jgi:uncharacterized tellurite resistance protein B-like protein